jgi:protein-S-isoprenylcysteine O-methyltransferase Ste14
MNEPAQSAAIKVVPPVYFLICIALGVGLNQLLPAIPLTEPAASIAGWLLVALALIVNKWSVACFKRANTPLHVKREALIIVTSGPYRFSRNPLYLSMLAATAGAALIADLFWLLITLPVLAAFLDRKIIAKEETYLVEKFGAPYLAYQQAVRRWL